MPRISKIRIVNFNYNGGSRWLLDDLYDLSNKEGVAALNTLFNFGNGVGKTVLVQLMMQPIIPKAKAQNRRIEDYFSKASDHFFVLLEWIKDNSTEKLLTGIAMAARESSVADDDVSRGRSVKYYTFYSNYSDYATGYDIVNLPLSKKENGAFLAADFDAVRAFAKKSNGALNYYVDDDREKWWKKLSEYGIFRSVWKLIENLNSTEGGLEKFFGEYKSSDSLINNLLLPHIEEQLSRGYAKEDSSLSTMVIAYANQYASKQDVLREKEVYEAFSRGLTAIRPNAEELWNASDALERCIRDLFGLSDALELALRECKALQERYAGDLGRLDAQISRIEYERASASFYRAKERYEAALKEFTFADEGEKKILNQLNDTKHTVLVLECAEYYQKLLDVDADLTVIQREIKRRESGGENGLEIASLKYSASVQINNLLSQNKSACDELQLSLKNIKSEVDESAKQLKASEISYENAKEEHTRADERLRSAEQETDREMSKCGVEIIRRFDGMYADEEIDGFRESRLSEQKVITDSLARAERERETIEAELVALPQKKTDLSIRMLKASEEVQRNKIALVEYRDKESRVAEICREYNLDFSLRFSDHIKEYLSSELRANQTKQAEIIRKISVSDEQLASAVRGSLHIPSTVIEYLNSTGVRYSTCEKYLNEQVLDGKISNEKCLEILRNYPAAAFGVLMEPAEKVKFFAFGREKWLPAMVPVFTYEHMARILNLDGKHDGAIAFYSEEYFVDTKQYIQHIENNKSDLISSQNVVRLEGARLVEQIKTLEAFAYSSRFEEEQKALVERLELAVLQIDKELTDLDARKEFFLEKRNTVDCKIRELKNEIENIQRVLDGVEKVQERIVEERIIAQFLNARKSEREKAKHEYEQIKSRCALLKNEFDRVSDDLTAVQHLITELDEAKCYIGECEPSAIIEGDWRELYAQYRSLQAALNQELSGLTSQLEEKGKRKQDYEREIKKREISVSEYEGYVASIIPFERIERERENVILLTADWEEARKRVLRSSERKGQTENALKSAEEVLNKYGEPLDMAEICGDFELRLNSVRKEKEAVLLRKECCAKRESTIRIALGRLNDRTRKLPRIEPITTTQLGDYLAEQFERTVDNQFERVVEDYESSKGALDKARSQVLSGLRNMQEQFAGSVCGVSDAIDGMLSLFSNEVGGDRYYTLIELIDGSVLNTQRAVAKIMTDIREFENIYNDLVRQCALQGERAYKGLLQMAASSGVIVYEGKGKKQMIRFDVPSEVDPVVADASIRNELDVGIKELVAVISKKADSDVEIRALADRIVSSKNLLRKYIGKDTMRVDAYKIDRNPQVAGYRSWEETQIQNSGAERFVVYFTIILSLINYTRADFGSVRDKDLYSVLILDNPFGSTTSKHILDPMFAIAKHFHVQMICLSHIDQPDVINCFDVVIRGVLKRFSCSNVELLTHEENELIEHGFYRSEQIALL